LAPSFLRDFLLRWVTHPLALRFHLLSGVAHPFWVPRPSGLNVFVLPLNIMSFDYLGRSADLNVNGFPEGTTNTDIAKAIMDYFVGQNVKVLAIQQCPNKIARVTFDDRTACELIRLRVELDMNGVKVPEVPPPPPPPNWVNVVVYNYPYDALNEFIGDVLNHFGKIQNIRYQHWTNLPTFSSPVLLVLKCR